MRERTALPARLAIPFALSVLAVALALAPPARRATAQGSAAEYVLVQRDAPLHAAPAAHAESARDPWGDRFQQRIGPWFVLRFVAERDGFVEVATLPAFRASDHCYPTVPGLDGMDLRLFVRADAIARVTTRTVRRDLGDGTAVTLVAGVGVTPRGRTFEAAVRGATLRVPLAPEDVGSRYRPDRRLPVLSRPTGLLAAGARIALGSGASLAAERAGRATRAERPASGVVDFSIADTRATSVEDGPPRALLAVETDPGARGPRLRATVRTDCAEVLGDVDRRAITTDRPPRAIEEPRQSGNTLMPGATLYWPDGSRAGRATDRGALWGEMRRSGANLCFEHPLRSASDHADERLTLCVDRTSVLRSGR